MQEGICVQCAYPISPAADGSLEEIVVPQIHILSLSHTGTHTLKFSYLVGREANDEAPICFKWFDLLFTVISTVCTKITVFRFNQPLLFLVHTHFQLFWFGLFFLIFSMHKHWFSFICVSCDWCDCWAGSVVILPTTSVVGFLHKSNCLLLLTPLFFWLIC